MLHIEGLAHFSIPVSDLERSKAFYMNVLDMRLLKYEPNHGYVFLDAGGDCVILARVKESISTSKVRNVHHAFKVSHDHYQTAMQILKDRGVEIIFEEDRRDGAVNGPRFYFYDPDGNALEIIDLTSYSGNVRSSQEQ